MIILFLLNKGNWATIRAKYQIMRKELEFHSREIESFHLTWCKMEPYVGEKLGGLGSENYLALTRLLPWMYGFMEDINWDEPISIPGFQMECSGM